MQDYIFLLFIGSIAGLLSGMLGIGGGIIMVPGMLEWIHLHGFETTHAMQISTGTALSGITIMSLISGLSHRKLGVIRWDLVSYLVPGTASGVLVGVYIADSIPSFYLRQVFIAMMVLVTMHMIFAKSPKDPISSLIKPWIFTIFGFFIGILSGLIGLGGGLMIVPLLMFHGVSMVQCSSTAIWCTIPTVFAGTIMAVWSGLNETDLLEHCLGYVYWPATLVMCVCALVTAPTGAWLAHRLPRKVIKLFLVGVMITIITRMIVI